MPEDETFKITDRRGRPKDTETVGAKSVASDEPREPAAASSQASPSSRPSRARASAPSGPDLQGLFVMFATSALINLGEAADPATGATRVDLQQAQGAIDLLILLRDKTTGNRTDQESRLLEDILYDLQMRFVRVSREHTAP